MHFRPVNHEASRALPFGSYGFWNDLAARGAAWVCSFQWPLGSTPVRPSFTGDPPVAIDWAWLNAEAWPEGPAVAPGGAGTRRSAACSQRPPALFPLTPAPTFRQAGLLRVNVTAHTLLRIDPATTTSLDFYLDRQGNLLGGDGAAAASPLSFARSLQVAIFEELCGEHGFVAAAPAPRGRFTPAIGDWAFFRAVDTRGASCHYQLCWPLRMEPLERFSATPPARPP